MKQHGLPARIFWEHVFPLRDALDYVFLVSLAFLMAIVIFELHQPQAIFAPDAASLDVIAPTHVVTTLCSHMPHTNGNLLVSDLAGQAGRLGWMCHRLLGGLNGTDWSGIDRLSSLAAAAELQMARSCTFCLPVQYCTSFSVGCLLLLCCTVPNVVIYRHTLYRAITISSIGAISGHPGAKRGHPGA